MLVKKGHFSASRQINTEYASRYPIPFHFWKRIINPGLCDEGTDASMLEFNALQSGFGIIYEANKAVEVAFVTRLLAHPFSGTSASMPVGRTLEFLRLPDFNFVRTWVEYAGLEYLCKHWYPVFTGWLIRT
jgi:hypothetical protein